VTDKETRLWHRHPQKFMPNYKLGTASDFQKSDAADLLRWHSPISFDAAGFEALIFNSLLSR